MANPVINSRYFKPQKEWGWQVAVDLYLAGMGSGALVIGLLVDWLGYSPYSSRTILLWGPVLVAFGALFLISKLGIRRRFLNTVMNPKTSWLSRGFYILSVCIIFGAVILAISLLPLLGVDIGSWSLFVRALDMVVFIFALAAAVYTGILVRSVRFVSFWHTYLLPVLFTVSALTTGAMATVMATYTYDLLVFNEAYSSNMRNVLMNITQGLILIEAIVLALYLYTRYMAEEGQSRNSVLLLISGRLWFVFWLGIVASGFALPLVLAIIYSRFSENPILLFAIGALVLASRLLLRLAIIYAGIKDQTPWHKFVELQYYLKFPDAGPVPLRNG